MVVMRFDLVTIGTATRDVFLRSDSFFILEDKKHAPGGKAECFPLGAKIDIGEPVFTIGGGAANAAITGARQGLKTAAVFSVGNDESGETIIEVLKEEGVKIYPEIHDNLGTAYSTIMLQENGERTVLVYRGASEEMSYDDLFFGSLKTKWVYITPGGLPFGVISNAIKTARKNGAKVAINPSSHYIKTGKNFLREIMTMIDVVIMNREEAAEFTGVAQDDEAGIFKAFDGLVLGLAVMTDGRNGVSVSDGKILHHAGVFKEKQIADRTGAGDAFGSGFVAALINGYGEKDAVRIASANATSVVEQIGAQAGILRTDDLKDARWKFLPIISKRI